MDDLVSSLRANGARRGRNALSVFDELRADIIALKLEPGTVLSRAALQERFGVSSTPIRDALMRLEEEHLVEVFPQSSTLVAPIDLEQAREAQFLRRSLEIEVIRTLARQPDAALTERLRSLIRQGQAFADLNEIESFAHADQMFHRTMFEGARVVGLWLLVQRQSGHINRLRRLHLPVKGKMTEILAAHARIVDGIAAGDAAGAEAAMRDHLSRSLDFVDRLSESYPQYFRK